MCAKTLVGDRDYSKAKGNKKCPDGEIPCTTQNDVPTKRPEYIDHRLQIFEKYYSEYIESLGAKKHEKIKVKLIQTGDVAEVVSFEERPIDLFKTFIVPQSKLKETPIICKINGQLWDLVRPLEVDCDLEFLSFEHPEAKKVLWHSSAHILGEACELYFGCYLCSGPPTDSGFFYDFWMDDTVKPTDCEALERVSNTIIQEKQPFKRLVVTKPVLLEMFKHNKYKLHFIKEKVKDGESSTVYRCGTLVDLCMGPHVANTGVIKSFALTKTSSSYFLGSKENDALQRVYGISFPDKQQMQAYKKFIEEASSRDHRLIGQDQELFFFDEFSAGSCFFLPAGAKICENLLAFHRQEYRKRGFKEVVTPNIYNSKLWLISGHWQNYSEDMFRFKVEDEEWALKPMNCPGHCLMFKRIDRSYRELPIRFADFGVLHRNEASGALSGLTRVRKFQQDDAHIFCAEDQLESEIDNCLDFLTSVYKVYGFSFDLVLSTRPQKYIGEIELWNKAEDVLKSALERLKCKWSVNEGDGAFYGPKIDVIVMDALMRKHQCGTIQLDFQLPLRFNLRYRSSSSSLERPVMIHRAIMGSLERFVAIITEHYSGKWPFWLSPRHVMVVPASSSSNEYAKMVAQQLYEHGFEAEADTSTIQFNKKIRNAQMARWNFSFVVGAKEQESNTVTVRPRDASEERKTLLVLEVPEAIRRLKILRDSKSPENSLGLNIFDNKSTSTPEP